MSHLFLSVMVVLGGDACTIQKTSPIGLANQGGNKFEYQSGIGPSQSGKVNCLLYRARNTQNGASVSLEWKEDASRKSEVLLQAWLDECPSGKCPWDEAILPTKHDIFEGDTYLGFGANSNQHNVTPTAYRRKVKQSSTWPALTTILRRVFGGDDPPQNDDEREVVLGVRVTSSVEGDRPPYTLRYTITSLERNNTYEVFPQRRLEGETLGVIWENVPRTEFITQLKEMDFPKLTADRRDVTLTVRTNEFEVGRKQKLRIVQNRGGRDRTILATTAAAYVPKNAN